MTTEIQNLQDLLDSRELDGCRFGNSSDDWMRDEERMKRCDDAAKEGCDGSTHGEHIQDWRDCLSDYFYDLDDETIDSINKEIDSCENWHIQNNSVDEEIG